MLELFRVTKIGIVLWMCFNYFLHPEISASQVLQILVMMNLSSCQNFHDLSLLCLIQYRNQFFTSLYFIVFGVNTLSLKFTSFKLSAFKLLDSQLLFLFSFVKWYFVSKIFYFSKVVQLKENPPRVNFDHLKLWKWFYHHLI